MPNAEIPFNIQKIAPTPFFADRGCHVRILEEAKTLIELGNKVTICTYHNGRDVYLPNLKIRRIPSIPWYNKLEAGPSYHMLYLDALLLLESLKSNVNGKPDIIHAHLHEGALIGKVCAKIGSGIPMVFDVQGSLVEEMVSHRFIQKDSSVYKLIHIVEKNIDYMADAIVTSSTNMADILANEFYADPQKIHVVKDGVDTNQFRPDIDAEYLRKDLKIPKDKKIIVYLGLLNEYQGIDYLLSAIPKVLKSTDKAYFLIMGYPNVEYYRKIVENMGMSKSVHFSGRIDYSIANKYLALGDVAISPKIPDAGEGNGKLYNYMASGLPTVVFDHPTNREILGEFGIYAKLGSSDSLAECLIELLVDEALCETLGKKVRNKAVEEYSWLKVGEKLISIYKYIS
ncbi:MAG: glycosyltransferase family 4 protein [Candidatus Methanoperedens sp.]|nr:glycosyltransferase family 4 protein [Candidatus Methanoperedens sp.]MCZ7405179.1 glycosyltransferase family 4 protein [Candidatus Methanoperedens sp.]